MVTIGTGRDDPRRWVEAAYVILDAVASGEIAPGDPVPSTAELAARLGISADTIRRAFRELTALGILYRVAGPGYFTGPAAAPAEAGSRR
jgi:DNA-binding GntR family transcriptional regulator